MKKLKLKMLACMLIVILLLTSCSSVFAFTIYQKQSTKRLSISQSILNVLKNNLQDKINSSAPEDSKKEDIAVEGTTPEIVTETDLSESSINTIKSELVQAQATSDKLSIWDIAKFIFRISSIYKNVNTGPQTITQSKQLAILCSVCSSTDNTGPISVSSALLTDNDGVKKEVTLVTLGGTEFIEGQATDVTTDILSGLEQSNDYLKAVVNLFQSVDSKGNSIIPKDKPVIVAGISLGGMVAQQLLAQKSITDNYTICNIVCFGSPVISAKYRQDTTTVKRLCDSTDIVPFLSVSGILNLDTTELDKKEKIVRDGGYKTFIGAHALGYVDAACWNSFDVLGVENGKATLQLTSNMTFYDAPLQNKN